MLCNVFILVIKNANFSTARICGSADPHFPRKPNPKPNPDPDPNPNTRICGSAFSCTKMHICKICRSAFSCTSYFSWTRSSNSYAKLFVIYVYSRLLWYRSDACILVTISQRGRPQKNRVPVSVSQSGVRTSLVLNFDVRYDMEIK